MMTVCETRITYNDVELLDVLTEAIDFSVEYDSTGVDPVGMKVSIDCVAEIHTSPNWEMGHQVAWDPPQLGPELSRVSKLLLAPRRRFQMSIGNYVMFDVLPSCAPPSPCGATPYSIKSESDIHHGPRASMQVLAVKGDRAAKCKFHFEFVRQLCNDDVQGVRDLLNMRYWIIDDVDGKTWQTRRTYAGILRTKGKCVSPHAIARSVTLPPIQPRFRRESINWSESPNGLELQFAIVDMEQYAMAPAPATHWEGSYSVSIPTGSIAIETDLKFRLWGDPDLEKRHLFKLAQRIIDHKLHYAELLTQKNVLVLSQVWSERLEANEVSCEMRIKHMGEAFVLKNLSQFSGGATIFELGNPLPAAVSNYDDNPARRPYNKDYTWIPPNAPSSGLAGLFLSALQTACCASVNDLSEGGNTTYQPEVNILQYQYPLLPDTLYDPYPQQKYSEDHKKDGTYLWYRLSNRYLDDTGWRAFPLGTQCSQQEAMDTVAFAHLHCPVEIREVKIHAARIDRWPKLPAKQHWVDQSANVKYVLKKATVEPCAIQLAADGRHQIREVYATYTYLMSRPVASDRNILVGANPYVDMSDLVGVEMTPNDFTKPSDILGTGV